MARLLKYDSFRSYNSSSEFSRGGWTIDSTTAITLSASGGRFGDPAMRVADDDFWGRIQVPSGPQTLILGVALHINLINLAGDAFLSRIVRLAPTSDVQAEFTRSGGAANYEAVDEIPADDDTTYVESATVGQQDRYGLGDLPGTPVTIHGVGVKALARDTDAGGGALTRSPR